jgi:subtilisin family serine protease
VAAVGNAGSGNVLYLAAYEQVIGVGAVTKETMPDLAVLLDRGVRWSFCRPRLGYQVDVAWRPVQYKLSSGTSMATPFVTGAIALLLGSDEHAWSDTQRDGGWRRQLDKR